MFRVVLFVILIAQKKIHDTCQRCNCQYHTVKSRQSTKTYNISPSFFGDEQAYAYAHKKEGQGHILVEPKDEKKETKPYCRYSNTSSQCTAYKPGPINQSTDLRKQQHLVSKTITETSIANIKTGFTFENIVYL